MALLSYTYSECMEMPAVALVQAIRRKNELLFEDRRQQIQSAYEVARYQAAAVGTFLVKSKNGIKPQDLGLFSWEQNNPELRSKVRRNIEQLQAEGKTLKKANK